MRTTSLVHAKFCPPTDYYCEEIDPIDEQLCSLIAKRKEVSGNNPGFPGVDRISAWCQQYELEEQMILAVFGRLCNENRFQSPPAPTGFRRFVPIVKYVEIDGVVFAVTHMKQYANVSMVYIEISPMEPDNDAVGIMHTHVDLSIGPEYTCFHDSGGGNDKSMQYGFSVTPTLPDDISEVEFTLHITPRQPDSPKRKVPLKAGEVTIK